MGLFKTLDTHSKLVSNMSDRVGVDWEDVLSQRPELAMQYRSAVMKCTQCQEVGACQGWLKTNHNAKNAPEYCENRDLLAELKRV